MARILIGNIKGPVGPIGPQGKQGIQGPAGPQGPLPPLTNNALTTQAGVSALDAVMGKTLQDQITTQNNNLAAKFVNLNGVDLNTIKDTCWGYCNSCTNRPPVNENGYLEVIRNTDDYVMQRYTGYRNHLVYTRECIAGSWSDWARFILDSDLTGIKNIKKIRTLSTGVFSGTAKQEKEIIINTSEFDTANCIVVPRTETWCTTGEVSYPSKTSVRVKAEVLIDSNYCNISLYLIEFDKSPQT